MSDIRYFDLTIPAARRLQMMRDALAKHPTKYPHCPEHVKPRTWRDIRAYTHGSWAAAFIYGLHGGLNIGRTKNDERVYYTHGGPYFRNEQFADDVDGSYIRHRGWFTDVDRNSVVRGIVASLPHGRFLAGTYWDDNGERVYYAETFNDEVDAARMADEHARIFGEHAVEDSERYERFARLENELQDKCDDIREYIKARNVSEYMREKLRDMIEELRTIRAEHRELSELV